MFKSSSNQQEKSFFKNCRLINLFAEYPGYTGAEEWAIVTELSEEEMRIKYPAVICRYTPFLLLSIPQGEVINESYRNKDKYTKRAKRGYKSYWSADRIAASFLREQLMCSLDPLEILELREQERQRQAEIRKIRRIVNMLTQKQRTRLVKYLLKDKSSNQIAKEEGTYHSTVLKSIRAAIKNFRKYYAEL